MAARLVRAVLVASPWAWFVVGDLTAPFEVVAIVLPAVGAAALVAGLVLAVARRWTAVMAMVSVAAMTAAATLLPRRPLDIPSPPVAQVTLVSANLAVDNPTTQESVRAVVELVPDIAVSLEANLGAVVSLADTYPYVVTGEPGVRSQVAVHSWYRLEPLDLPAPAGAQVVPVRVHHPQMTLTLFAVHLPRPWIRGSTERAYQATVFDQQRIVDELAATIATVEGPVVVAGDLNLTDRGRGYHRLVGGAGLVDLVRSGWGPTTSVKWWPLALRIDHILARGGVCAADPATVELPGSDHVGLAVALGPCPPGTGTLR
jgi:endonuclease/exonuclease/phosphatase (EEP) superfamily protein YafD